MTGTALALLNDPLVLRQAQLFAARVKDTLGKDIGKLYDKLSEVQNEKQHKR